MSWKRCWNGGYNQSNFYEADYDEQIVPDIDRGRPTSSSSSSLSSTSSMDASTSSTSSSLTSARGGIDYHHHQAGANSSLHAAAASGAASAATSSPSPSYRAFPSKRDNSGSNSDASFKAAIPSVFSNSHHHHHNGHSSALQSASTSSSPWSNHKSPLNSSDFFGSRNGEKRPGLELNDFWEEKYSRIAVITTPNHFGQTMSNKL